jgi:hypothetical protein
LDKKAYYKKLFIVAAIWNLGIAILLLIGSFFGTSGFQALSLMYYQGFLMAVLLFGIAYLMVGLDLGNNHLVILLGAIAKALLFLLFLIYYLSGDLPLFHMLAGVGDLIFSIFFIEFLINYKKL